MIIKSNKVLCFLECQATIGDRVCVFTLYGVKSGLKTNKRSTCHKNVYENSKKRKKREQ